MHADELVVVWCRAEQHHHSSTNKSNITMHEIYYDMLPSHEDFFKEI
jgi:hypothetical protein